MIDVDGAQKSGEDSGQRLRHRLTPPGVDKGGYD